MVHILMCYLKKNWTPYEKNHLWIDSKTFFIITQKHIASQQNYLELMWAFCIHFQNLLSNLASFECEGHNWIESVSKIISKLQPNMSGLIFFPIAALTLKTSKI